MMQYILTEKEYKEFIRYKEESERANRVMRSAYDEEDRCFNFNQDSYRMLMCALGNSFGSAYTANVCGTKFIITKDHAEGCRIASMLENL